MFYIMCVIHLFFVYMCICVIQYRLENGELAELITSRLETDRNRLEVAPGAVFSSSKRGTWESKAKDNSSQEKL